MIYLDNAATSWPKPVSVCQEMEKCLLNYCANPGRSGHDMSLKSQKIVFNCREKISDFFGLEEPSGVVFTSNATTALNTVIKGLLTPERHAVITSMEHNSVMRPLVSSGASYDVVAGDRSGYVCADDVEKHIKNNTSLIICTLSSNVCGSVEPFEKMAQISFKHKIPFLLDASQGAGSIPISMKKMNIDFLAAPGHKGLLGPTGTGILCINTQTKLKTLCEGGTGSESKLLTQPDILPDRYESGTLNVVGIAGLLKGIEYIEQVGIENILKHENRLCNRLAENISAIKGVQLVGYDKTRQRCAVLSFVFDKVDSLVAAAKLNYEYGIAVRAGYHCAYTAHCTLGTENTGTVRVSFGPFNTIRDVERTTMAIKQIALQK